MTQADSSNSSVYTTEDLVVLSDREHVRIRPAMYVGNVDGVGVALMLDMVLDRRVNVVDSADAVDQRIEVALQCDGSISVAHHGSVQSFEQEKEGCERWAGLHDGGLAIVNFLSEAFELFHCRGGLCSRQTFVEGLPTSEVEQTPCDPRASSLKITFRPDRSIFALQSTSFEKLEVEAEPFGGMGTSEAVSGVSFFDLKRRVRELAALNAGVAFTASCRAECAAYCFRNGLADAIEDNEGWAITGVIHGRSDLDTGGGWGDEVAVEVAFRWSSQGHGRTVSYANTIRTQRGEHVVGWRRAVDHFLRQHGVDADVPIDAAIAVRMKHPQFVGATRSILKNSEAATAVERVTTGALERHFTEHPEDLEKLLAFR